MRSRVACCALLAAVSTGTAGCRQKAPPPAEPAVATFDGGRVTAADVDRAVLELPPERRQPADGDLLTWYERIARDLAMQSVLVAEARQAGLERERDFERVRDEARRQATVAVFLEKSLPRLAAPTAQEVEAYYREHSSQFKSPPARQVHHLFRRVSPGADPAPVVAEVRRLRERSLAGEDFGQLAGEFSESESRHRKGLLGWITPGKVAPELEKVVFALPLRVPSQPIRTAAGVHLFVVSAEQPAKTLTLSEVRNAIGVVLADERRKAEVAKLIGSDPLPGSMVPTDDELRTLFEAGDPSAVALRVDDYQLTLGQLQARLLAGQLGIAAGGDSPAHALVVGLEQRERAYRKAVAQGVDRSPEVAAAVERLLERELAGLQLRKRLVERIDRDPQRLQEYYDANRSRFSTPLRLKVQRLSVPLEGDANRAMARLERARPELDAGRLDFAALAAELGGTLLEPVWDLPTRIALRERRPSSPTAGLRAGKHSAPYRTQDHIEMVRVLERSEPEEQPLERVRERVRTDLLVTHRQEEYAALVQEVLASRHYAVARSELEAMLKRPAAEGG